MKKKLLIGIFISLFTILGFVKPIVAFETPDLDYQIQFEEAISAPEMNLQSFVNEVLKAVMAASTRLAIGQVPNPREEKVSLNLDNSSPSGLIPSTLFVFSKAYSYQPASGIKYFSNLAKRLTFTEEAFASETGFMGGLSQLQPIWTTFRNITYILFALVLIFLGFAIMFRMKISPQAVITIQSALPRIILALILITFSYAIVGLLLDVMAFINNLIMKIFNGIISNQGGWESFREFTRLNEYLPGMTDKYLLPGFDAFDMVSAGLTFFFIYLIWVFPIVGFILLLILSIVVIIALFRCLFTILKAMTMIIINIIFAPLRILAGAFPGSTAINDWFKELISNMAIIPFMLVIFYISAYLMLVSVPESVGTLGFSGLKGFINIAKGITDETELGVAFILPFVGLGLLLMAPKTSEIIQSFINKKPFDYGSAVGEYGTIGARIGQKGWQTFREKSGMAVRQEGERKAKIDAAAKKYERENLR